MLEHLATTLDSSGFMPHGMCFLWRLDLLFLHVLGDGLTALAYFSIPFALVYFATKRRDLVFRGIFLLFGAFILACGSTHLMGIWTIWRPDYWLDGGIKLATGLVSVTAAVSLWRLLPEALALPGRGQLAAANQALERQIGERRAAEDQVRRLNAELERRVAERTAELEEMNARLCAALHEKEVLLREVHHRVKNNLQVISGLLTLQARNADPSLADYFQASLARIQAMGRVHEQLYRADDVSSFDVGQFIQGIAAQLAAVHGASSDQVRCRVEVRGDARVPLEIATPLALIVNEVIANAYKHAFPEGAGGEISVALDESEAGTRIVIADNGVGLPVDHAERSRRSMGMRLIQLLARQIGATLDIECSAGTRFRLALPPTRMHTGNMASAHRP